MIAEKTVDIKMFISDKNRVSFELAQKQQSEYLALIEDITYCTSEHSIEYDEDNDEYYFQFEFFPDKKNLDIEFSAEYVDYFGEYFENAIEALKESIELIEEESSEKYIENYNNEVRAYKQEVNDTYYASR